MDGDILHDATAIGAIGRRTVKHAFLNREFGPVRTVVVFGVGRGGTSVIAGALRVLGVCMGATPHPLKHEWSPITYLPEGKIDLPATKQVIQAMDRDYPIWGWKSPRDVFQMEQVLSFLREPGFIFVTRDLLEASLSGLSYQDVPLYISLDETAAVFQDITSKLYFWPWPILVLPFAGALQEPAHMVELLCSFVGITPPADTRDRAVDFVRPGHNAYRVFDAGRDDPPYLTPEEDLRADSEGLAADLSNRSGQQYLRHFHALLVGTKELTKRVGLHLGICERCQSAMKARLGKVWKTLPDEYWRKMETALPLDGVHTGPDLRLGLARILDHLTAAAEDASRRITERASDSGYHDLTTLHRIVQVLIRIRHELQRGAALAQFPCHD